MKTKKKYGFVKVLLVVLLLVMIATYCIKGRSDSYSYLGFGDVLLDYIQSFYYFFDTIVFIFIVGGFYGALNKVPAYKKLVKGIADKVEGKKKLFIVIVSVIFALLASLAGFNLLSLIFIPFVVSIILVLGYDKLVAISSTVVATIVGFIGGLFLTFKDASNQYATAYTTFDKMVGLKGNWGNVFPKILLLVVGVFLLDFFIISYIKKNENSKEEIDNNDVFFVETKVKNGRVVKKNDDKIKVWPLVLMGCLLVIVLVLGFLPWEDLFGIKCFGDFHTWLTGLKIGKFEVFNSVISKSFTAFGKWSDIGNFMMANIILITFLFILKFVSRVKFNDLVTGFIYGAKKMIAPVMIVALAYTVLVATYNNGFMETVIKASLDKFGDNVIINSLITMVGSIFSVDNYYAVSAIFTPIISNLPDKANLNVYAILFQSFYGLVQICGPTSLLLIVGLTYLEVPYGKWLKYIWRFVLEMFIVIFVVLMIVSAL